MLSFSLSTRAWLRLGGFLVAALAYLLQAHRSLSSRAASYVKAGHWAVVLGGSEDIGEAWAFQLAHLDMNLVLVARRLKPLEDVKEALLKSKPNIQVDLVTQDLAQLNESRIAEMLEGREVRLLIHNAAHVGATGSFLDADPGSFMSSVDVNVKSVATASYVFGNELKLRGVPGGIMLMSSIAGEVGSAYVANYAATKAYITTLSRGLSDEWWPIGVDALACVAGATITPTYLQSTSAGARALIEQEPLDVVQECLANLGRTSMIVTGALNKMATAIWTRVLPKGFATQTIGQQTGRMLGIS